MSLMDRMKDVFLTRFGTVRRTSHLQSLLQVTRNIKSSLLTKQTIPLPMYNSSLERLLRSSPKTAGLSLPVITKTKLSTLYIVGVLLLISQLIKNDKPTIAAQFFARLNSILEEEKVEADKKVLAELINKHFPDWRRVLNECQRYAVSGKIDSGILAAFSDVAVNDLIKNLKQKNFSEVRKWVVTNMDNDTSVLLRRIYDSLYDSLEHSSIPAAVLIIAKYQYQIAFVADQEINLLAALTEIMVECEFK